MSPLARTFWLGAGLIVLSNALALGGVVYNRSGEPDSLLRLSERELSMAYGVVVEGSEYAGQVLELDYRVAKGWVNVQKLRSLGFAAQDSSTTFRRDRVQREGLVVLELNGVQYQAELAAAEADLKQTLDTFAAAPQSAEARQKMEMAQYELDRLRASSTRLYVVDAGLDGDTLRERYPDRTRYSVVRANLRMGVQWKPAASAEDDYLLYADLPNLSVPGQWRTVFSAWQPYDRSAEERSKVSVELAFGKRLEPWITSAQKVELP
ncbi:DUF4824 family protein [Pseudomonas turukhanskensis]|uniref:DUF4824 domain-containing protein n=1 Tax=Pseudomonas turukhanskensis TaxID=1806536 RepID=A0A9W6K8D0_9PSED|nr:DUF4824 family protein [Pseudomonas turukhanskensis]GLK89939.1 DUF4824 domain-containing protein [Pseudomonas turukhanskensis]